MEKIICGVCFSIKNQNASEKMNGEVFIQNGDFSILHGENSL
jgi:hypothetical protein